MIDWLISWSINRQCIYLQKTHRKYLNADILVWQLRRAMKSIGMQKPAIWISVSQTWNPPADNANGQQRNSSCYRGSHHTTIGKHFFHHRNATTIHTNKQTLSHDRCIIQEFQQHDDASKNSYGEFCITFYCLLVLSTATLERTMHILLNFAYTGFFVANLW